MQQQLQQLQQQTLGAVAVTTIQGLTLLEGKRKRGELEVGGAVVAISFNLIMSEERLAEYERLRERFNKARAAYRKELKESTQGVTETLRELALTASVRQLSLLKDLRASVLQMFYEAEHRLQDAINAHAMASLRMAKKGKLIGPNDLWLAATCLAHGLKMVTANVREFSRVPGLEVEAWGPSG